MKFDVLEGIAEERWSRERDGTSMFPSLTSSPSFSRNAIRKSVRFLSSSSIALITFEYPGTVDLRSRLTAANLGPTSDVLATID